MAFDPDEVCELLARCHRRCCICHRYCGVKMETDHIEPAAESANDNIENAIPLCFECHAETHSYNDKHPRGRKFRPKELRLHKEQWLKICASNPGVFVEPVAYQSVGPIAALVDELEFNMRVAELSNPQFMGSLFMDDQFRRAIQEGAISLMDPELKRKIIEAYTQVSRANHLLQHAFTNPTGHPYALAPRHEAGGAVGATQGALQQAHDALMSFVAPES